jgi:hypothetical protein
LQTLRDWVLRLNATGPAGLVDGKAPGQPPKGSVANLRCCLGRRTLAGYEVMAMVRKGQLRKIEGRDMRTQATFIAELFQVAA